MGCVWLRPLATDVVLLGRPIAIREDDHDTNLPSTIEVRVNIYSSGSH